MQEEKLSVPSISCGHCKASIEDAVGKLDGIQNVNVTVDTKMVDVQFDAAQTSLATITKEIEDQGFDVAG